MDREEMIEKVARIICEHKTLDDCSCPDPQRVACTAYNKARDILTSIIPDGAVVLTREELKKEVTFYEVIKEQARKETARDFAHKYLEWLSGNTVRNPMQAFLEFLKQQGLEVE